MRRLTPIIVLLAVLAAAPSASAKGPSHAEISGPGLRNPIVFKGYGEPGADSAFGRLVDGLGFFPAAFGQQPSPMLSARPRGDLGPRYAVRYRVPTGGRPATITQTLYPYAAGGARGLHAARPAALREDDPRRLVPRTPDGQAAARATRPPGDGARAGCPVERLNRSFPASTTASSAPVSSRTTITRIVAWPARSTCCTSAARGSSARTCSTRRRGPRSTRAARPAPSTR